MGICRNQAKAFKTGWGLDPRQSQRHKEGAPGSFPPPPTPGTTSTVDAAEPDGLKGGAGRNPRNLKVSCRSLFTPAPCWTPLAGRRGPEQWLGVGTRRGLQRQGLLQPPTLQTQWGNVLKWGALNQGTKAFLSMSTQPKSQESATSLPA